MRYLALICCLLWPLTTLAQTQEDEDKDYLTSLIEDNLSGVSRDVSIIGFQGALSSEATIDVLTVSDAEGVWLTLEDIVLSWNRSALLRGAIDVQELSAERIVVARPPVSEDTGPSPEAQPFSLPELPVSISLDLLNIDEIELGEAFLGEPVIVSLTGTAQLSGGEGSANVVAERLGDKTGRFEIDGAYANATRNLDILLNLQEGADGIAARIIGLPGRPAVGLTIEGNAPLDDFDATLAIATNGQDRLNGTFRLTEIEDRREIALDVGGDISPLFEAEYQGFFGTDAELVARVVQSDSGRIEIPALELDAGRVALSGALQIDAQGWPERIDLGGGITPEGNEPVLLPLTGPQTFVDGMTLAINYDARVSDDWRADITIDGLVRPGLTINTLSLRGGGILQPGDGADIGRLTATLRYGAQGLRLDDAGAAEAFGDDIGGELVAARIEGGATEITRFTLSGAGLDTQAEATIAGPASGFQTNATINASVEGLERFATLIGQDIGGGAELGILANVTPLDGLFSIVATGQTNNLTVGVAEADRVLAGTGNIAASVVRDTDGTRLEVLNIRTDAAQLDANAELTNDGINGEISARVNELGQVIPQLSGPALVEGQVTTSDTGDITFELTGNAAATNFITEGTVSPTETGQTVSLSMDLDLNDLRRFAALAGRPLSGAGDLTIDGVVLTDGLRFDLGISGNTRNIVTGIDRLDPFLRGFTQLSGEIARPTANSLRVTDLSLNSPALRATGDANVSLEGSNSADLVIQINDAALLDPSLSGPIRLTLNADPAADDATQAALRLTGPDTDVTFDGTVGSPATNYQVSGDLSAQVGDLGTYATLIGQPVDGSIDLTASGEILPDLSAFDAQIRLQSEDLQTGNPTVDPLLAGAGRINAQLGQSDGVLAVRTLEISTPEVSIVGALNGAQGFGQGRFNASLRNVGVLTDQISGPIRATGSASVDEQGNWGIDATGTGPGGLGAQIAGQFGADGNLDMNIDGSAPLALANRAIDPRRLSGLANFDLSVVGPPAVTSLGGQITFSNGRLAAPNLGEALTDITGQIALSGGAARIDLDSRVESGGGISVNGPVGLDSPNNADVTVRLNNMVLQDPQLFRSSIDGTITLNGPLAGGARVAGRLTLGETNVRVPSSAISTLGDLPEVIHVGEDRRVRQTLARADALPEVDENGNGDRTPRRAFPLDIRIDAPGRIFIRGRGLDAELGGRLQIGGTSADVVPVGRFSLVRGRIDILQQRFELTEGSATLAGDFVPFIRLVATTETDSGTIINIIVEGPANDPEVRFESVPELPQDEVLSQLIFGRDLSSISPLQAIQLASAVSTLAGRGGGAFDRLRRNVGLDDLDITTDEEGETAVRAGRYISDNVYTDVTVTSEGETEINLNLDLTDDITAKGSVDQDGETSIGIFFERDY